MDGDIVLGANQYGKAEVRLVRITRDSHPENPDRHEIEDLNVSSQLRGDFTACHTDGDNSQVVATDTQKNTVYAYAQEHGVGSPEKFLLTLGQHFLDDFEWVHGGRWEAEQFSWARIEVDGQPHDHAFVRAGTETRTTVVQLDGTQDPVRAFVVSGLKDCTVLKSTGSEFHGFPRDRYTTLTETDDRILATSVTALWRYAQPTLETDYNGLYDAIKQTLLATFAGVHSLALQQSIFAVGKAVLEAYPEVAEIKLSCPNKHHFLVDLAPFGLKNPNEVFYAADRPYGLIEATVTREGTAPAPEAWATVPGFC